MQDGQSLAEFITTSAGKHTNIMHNMLYSPSNGIKQTSVKLSYCRHFILPLLSSIHSICIFPSGDPNFVAENFHLVIHIFKQMKRFVDALLVLVFVARFRLPIQCFLYLLFSNEGIYHSKKF